MARHKDCDWSLPHPEVQNWQQAGVAVLMDIRDELKDLNATMASINSLMHCRNFVQIPRKLDAIRLNTSRKKRAAKS